MRESERWYARPSYADIRDADPAALSPGELGGRGRLRALSASTTRSTPREGERSGTLRERLFGAGNARLPERHTAARYRGGANLDVPVEPLRLDFADVPSF